MSCHWKIKFLFTTVLCFAKFSAQEWNLTSINEVASDNEAILRQEMFSAVRRGDIVGFRKAINKGGLSDDVMMKFIDRYDYKEREYLVTKMNRKMWAIETLFYNKLVYSPSEEFLKSNPNDGRVFNITLIPETGLVTVLMLNLTAVKTWNKSMSHESTPLHSICNLPDVELRTVKLVLDSGLDINERSMGNKTALDLAAYVGNLALVKYLVEKGANPNAIIHIPINENSDHEPNYHKLIKVFSTKDIALEFTRPHSPLITAISEEEIEVVKYLLSAGADITVGKQGWAVLFPPVMYGSSEMVELLLNHGSDVNGRNFLGETALHMAADVGRLDMARLLLKHGTRVDAIDNSGWTPLHVAAFSSSNIGLIELLLTSGGRFIHTVTDRGLTPLNLAVARGNYGFLPCLSAALTLNFSMHEQMKCDNLTEMCSNDDRIDVIILLLNKGSMVNHQDHTLGWSALHWAAAIGDKRAAQLLVEGYGAAINSKSRRDMTPSETASYFGMKDLSEYLKAMVPL